MKLEAREVEGAKLVAVGQGLEGEALGALAELVSSLASQGPVRLLLDLSRCPHVSSEALRFFLQTARRLESQRGAFVLLSPMPEVARMLELSGVARLVQVAGSLAEVLQAERQARRVAALAQRVAALLARADASERP